MVEFVFMKEKIKNLIEQYKLQLSKEKNSKIATIAKTRAVYILENVIEDMENLLNTL
jgi:hypothetical protein